MGRGLGRPLSVITVCSLHPDIKYKQAHFVTHFVFSCLSFSRLKLQRPGTGAARLGTAAVGTHYPGTEVHSSCTERFLVFDFTAYIRRQQSSPWRQHLETAAFGTLPGYPGTGRDYCEELYELLGTRARLREGHARGHAGDLGTIVPLIPWLPSVLGPVLFCTVVALAFH
eukprot:2700067-Rhodomonas_salina.1